MNAPIVAPDMGPEELAAYIGGKAFEYRGYTISPKRDFGSRGFWCSRFKVLINAGWIVGKGFGNALPGATWAKTIAEAERLIDIFIEAEFNGPTFWALVRSDNAAAT